MAAETSTRKRRGSDSDAGTRHDLHRLASGTSGAKSPWPPKQRTVTVTNDAITRMPFVIVFNRRTDCRQQQNYSPTTAIC